jgi:monoamine oxidase
VDIKSFENNLEIERKNQQMSEHIVVVGAGIAGLWLTSKLSSMGQVVCLEASEMCGGRIRSIYDEKSRLLYEAGPWRVPETHKRVLRLFYEHSIKLGPLRTPPLQNTSKPKVVSGLCVWDVNALAHGASGADEKDLQTGYADQTHCASGSAPYTTDAKRYFVAYDGFTAMVDALQKDNDVRLNHRVVDVRRAHCGYSVHVVRRTGHNSFENVVIYADAVFVCVPPGVCRTWSIFVQHAKSVMNAVEEGQLHHIYVKAKMPSSHHYRDKSSLLSQSLSSQYGNEWFQASYSGGRIARLWRNLSLSDPLLFVQCLGNQVTRMWNKSVRFRSEDVRSHFWETAFHHWKAVPNFDMPRAVATAVCPSPRALPNVFLAGEAFSSHQAWMEGALETAELALAAYRNPFPLSNVPERAIHVEGHPLDVSKWASVHPGGEAIFANHKGEDVTELMNHVLHSPYAWAVVHSLKQLE